MIESPQIPQCLGLKPFNNYSYTLRQLYYIVQDAKTLINIALLYKLVPFGRFTVKFTKLSSPKPHNYWISTHLKQFEITECLLLKWESSPTLTKYSWVVQLISHGQSSSLKASFKIELDPLDFNMVSEPPLDCWADLPLYYGPRVWLIPHTWGGILKWESSLTLTKYSWVVQLISHGQSSSLKASFEIELGPLDFNISNPFFRLNFSFLKLSIQSTTRELSSRNCRQPNLIRKLGTLGTQSWKKRDKPIRFN